MRYRRAVEKLQHWPRRAKQSRTGRPGIRQRSSEASNPDGWGALGDGTRRLQQPHLPDGLAAKPAGAPDAMYVIPEPEELAVRARLVIEAASWFPGRPRDLAIAWGEEPESAGLL
jgi:hypothetical protein